MIFNLQIIRRKKELFNFSIELQDKIIKETSVDTIKEVFNDLETIFKREIKKEQDIIKQQVGKSDKTILAINTETEEDRFARGLGLE